MRLGCRLSGFNTGEGCPGNRDTEGAVIISGSRKDGCPDGYDSCTGTGCLVFMVDVRGVAVLACSTSPVTSDRLVGVGCVIGFGLGEVSCLEGVSPYGVTCFIVVSLSNVGRVDSGATSCGTDNLIVVGMCDEGCLPAVADFVDAVQWLAVDLVEVTRNSDVFFRSRFGSSKDSSKTVLVVFLSGVEKSKEPEEVWEDVGSLVGTVTEGKLNRGWVVTLGVKGSKEVTVCVVIMVVPGFSGY